MTIGSLLRNKPFIALFALSGCILVASFFVLSEYGDSTLDINIHDTYFVISHHHILNFTCVWIALCAFGYYVLYQLRLQLYFGLTIAHIVLSILGILGFVLDFGFIDFDDEPVRYYQHTSYPHELGFFIRVWLFPIGQAVYFLNIILSAVRRKYTL